MDSYIVRFCCICHYHLLFGIYFECFIVTHQQAWNDWQTSCMVCIPYILFGHIDYFSWNSKFCPFTRFPWNTRLILRVKFLHKVISYALILCGNAAIFTGIYGYRTNIWAKHPNNIPIELINIGLIVFLLAICEF